MQICSTPNGPIEKWYTWKIVTLYLITRMKSREWGQLSAGEVRCLVNPASQNQPSFRDCNGELDPGHIGDIKLFKHEVG